MMQFYTAIIESILTSSITVWYAGATIRDKQRLQRVVRSAEKVIADRLPSLQDLYTSRTLGRAARISADPSHPGLSLFDLLPSGRRLRSIRTRTSRHKNSFFPSAVGLMNNNHDCSTNTLRCVHCIMFALITTCTHVYIYLLSTFNSYFYVYLSVI